MNVLPVKVIYLHKSKYKRTKDKTNHLVDKTIKHTYKEAVNLFRDRCKNTEWRYSSCITKPFRKKSIQKKGGWIFKDKNNIQIGWVGNRGDVTIYNQEEKKIKITN